MRCSSKLSCSGTKKFRSLLRCNSKLSRSRACYCNAASSHAPELATATQQALTLWSLLLQRSKLSRSGACCCNAQALTLRNRKAPKLAALQQASFGAGQALEFAAATQLAPEPDKLQSLLRCSSKLSRSGACYCNAASCHALELATLQQASSGGCCCNATSFHAPEFAAAMQQAPEPRSSGACCVAGFSCSKQASELGACLPFQTKQTKIK